MCKCHPHLGVNGDAPPPKAAEDDSDEASPESPNAAQAEAAAKPADAPVEEAPKAAEEEEGRLVEFLAPLMVRQLKRHILIPPPIRSTVCLECSPSERLAFSTAAGTRTLVTH